MITGQHIQIPAMAACPAMLFAMIEALRAASEAKALLLTLAIVELRTGKRQEQSNVNQL